MDLADKISGRCLCGAVGFEITPPTGPMTHCHCRACRLSRGVAFVTWTSVPKERFAFVRGEEGVGWYRSSPSVRWGFCAGCGSQMFYVADVEGQPDQPTIGHVYVSVGSLAEPLDKGPEMHVSFEEHVGWIEGAQTLPRHRGKTGERMD